MSKECSALLQFELPPKLEGPRTFAVPITVQNHTYHGLCDLGASISVIPASKSLRESGSRETKAHEHYYQSS